MQDLPYKIYKYIHICSNTSIPISIQHDAISAFTNIDNANIFFHSSLTASNFSPLAMGDMLVPDTTLSSVSFSDAVCSKCQLRCYLCSDAIGSTPTSSIANHVSPVPKSDNPVFKMKVFAPPASMFDRKQNHVTFVLPECSQITPRFRQNRHDLENASDLQQINDCLE